MARMTIDDLLAEAREAIERLTPEEARAAALRGARVIDTRCAELLARDGAIEGAHHVPLSVLFWRLDPASGHDNPTLSDPSSEVILLCDHGYSSSLAAATLRRLGFARATDVIGGFQAWRESDVPMSVLP